jgi:hypothetical protein
VDVVEELGGEGFEFGGIFAGDDVGPGVDAGFQGIKGGAGFAFGVVGPVDFWALRRLALSCAWDGMG